MEIRRRDAGTVPISGNAAMTSMPKGPCGTSVGARQARLADIPYLAAYSHLSVLRTHTSGRTTFEELDQKLFGNKNGDRLALLSARVDQVFGAQLRWYPYGNP
jgi:hypothetical protein